MIGRILQGSLLYRLMLVLRSYYQESLFARGIEGLRRAYAGSGTRQVLEKRLGAPVRIKFSRFWQLFSRLNLLLYRIGSALRPAAQSSLILGAFRPIGRSEALKSSLLHRFVLSRGLKQFMIFLFAMYLPIDYAVRSIGVLSFLSSIWDEAFLLVSLVYVLFRRMAARAQAEPAVTPLDGVVLLFIGVGFFLMCINAPVFSVAVAGYRAIAQYLLWFFVLSRLLENDEDVYAFIFPFAALGTVIALHGIYQYIIDVENPVSWTSSTEMGVRTRVFSILGSPNIMGCFMVMAAPLTAALAYRTKNMKAKILYWICIFCMCAACLFTFSRGAWAALAVAVLIFAWYRDKRLIGLMAIAAGVAVYIPSVVNRITYLFTSDYAEASLRAGRTGRWIIGMDLLTKNTPWIGFGMGRFGGAVAMQNQVIEDLDYFYMDNYYLKNLVEMGYIGFAVYVLLIVCLLWLGIRCLFMVKKEPVMDASVGLFASIVGVLVHCFSENIFEVPYMNAYFWGMAAILIWIGFLRRPQPRGSGPFNPPG